MLKQVVKIGLAFVGIIIGAGFASGQETMQYFVAFGAWGIVGAIVSSLIMIIAGVSLMQLGSYYQAKEHMSALANVSSRAVTLLLDVSTTVTLFAVGFIMFAGAGSNLNQQFGWPLWAGAALMLALVLVVGLLDVDRVTYVIGFITPFIFVFILIATGWAIANASPDITALNVASQEVSTTLPNWWVAALNYTGFNVITATSMAIVIGGSFLDTKVAGWGGLFGGLIYLALLLLLAVSLFFEVELVNGDDLPALTLINQINPALGVAMAVVIYGMIFNTAISMFYALGKRLTKGRPKRFYPVFVVACLVGFILSFVGFKELIGFIYPLLGYLGLFLIAVVTVAWLRGRSRLSTEQRLRIQALDLTRRKLDSTLRFSSLQQRELAELAASSHLPDDAFLDAVQQEVERELRARRRTIVEDPR
ncbi:YkvI family membrane protein [Corynebacterium cystitidis]|uniref:Uncharacterized membrane protein YkvI n=1 Tax=Corynebacterium cystitidis DSM 20524 TaxID=1121357 RepID=A0A1H9U9V9_9CORY|nr:hypothetical protein [Corynebacterium cystitidis]WJY81239.1 hypothetical protein CCYS_01310 [Corynebacterium cystitidis DSM 20524]SES05934.1 Uncharacterized membrane protein YkvI [Corynebacterium cystitidis DSM 20524]SNV89047.1 hypothetical membrane protein [Corynebacterium cystitidis]